MNTCLESRSEAIRLTQGLVLAAWMAALGAPCGAAEDQTIVPAPGDYKMVEVVLEKGHPAPGKGDLVFRGGIRDGTLMIPESTSVRLKSGEFVFTADTVKGEFGWRKPDTFNNHATADAVIHRYVVDAKISAGAIEGTWKSPDGDRSGAVSGFVKPENDLREANTFTAGKDWAFYHGPSSSFAAAPCGLTLASDPANFRLVWKSEELMPCGINKGVQYLKGMVMGRTVGGGASPVVSADGKVYVNYMQPSGTASRLDQPYWGADVALEGLHRLAAARQAEVGPGALEKFLVQADDVIVCMDAVTGKTLWKTVFAEKGRNVPGDKIGPVNNTPCLGDGRVFAMGSLGRVYAVDGKTGKPLWEVPNIRGSKFDADALKESQTNAPVYVDGVVVMGNQGDTLHGFDAKTGAELWKLPRKSSSRSMPSRWMHQGKHFIVSPADKIYCIEPQSGTVVWETDYQGGAPGISVSGDILVGLTCSAKGEPKRDPECVAWRMTPEKAARIWTTTVQTDALLNAPTVNDKYVVVCNAGELQLLDLNTGAVLATAKPAKPLLVPPQVFMAENLVFVLANGSDGTSNFHVYGATPETFKFLGSWAPPHHQTSSIGGKCMTFPVVEGRMFIRGFDGINCYDLRQRN